jgi:hypothetical protein
MKTILPSLFTLGSWAEGYVVSLTLKQGYLRRSVSPGELSRVTDLEAWAAFLLMSSPSNSDGQLGLGSTF